MSKRNMLQPSGQTTGNFKLLAQTQEEEDAFNYIQFRPAQIHGVSVVGSIAHVVKGALGAGILSGHVAFMKIGVGVAVPMTLVFGMYMTYCLYILVYCAQIMYRRTRVTSMTYSDLGEAAVACFPNPKVRQWSKCFRTIIDVGISIDLFGSCACYQIIIAKSIKQLVENAQETTLEGKGDLPHIRVYMAAMIIPIICICMIRQLKYLAPFSLGANLVVVFCIIMTVYYAFEINPKFENLVMYTKFRNLFEFVGMSVFSMSCAGVVIPVENNMKDPHRFNTVLIVGMSTVVFCTFLVSFFGYIGYRELCTSPITVNFPMKTLPMILKGLIAFMIFITHALNFWVPFYICFFYIRKRVSERRLLFWEYFFRGFFVIVISVVGITFPTVDSLIGFIGTLCLSNMAFIWPNIIGILVFWARPGFGRFRWRLWKHVFLTAVGIFFLVCGTWVNGHELIKTLL